MKAKDRIQAEIRTVEELIRLAIENNDPIGSYQYAIRRELLIEELKEIDE